MMKKIILAILLITAWMCQALVSPVYIALPPDTYGIPADNEISFTATLMENDVTYIDPPGVLVKDQLTKDDPGCSYFVRSDGYCGIIRIDCGNFITDLASENAFNISINGDFTYSDRNPVLELTWSVDARNGETIYLELDGGIQSFGQGEGGEWEDGILPVTLASFTATFNNGAPVLQWITASENNNAGWNIYRAQSDIIQEAFLINSDIIEGQGTTSEESCYSYIDEYEFESTQYYYWLESIAYNGSNEIYGPITLQIPDDNNNNNTPEIPLVYGLYSNYPNPFNPSTIISFALDEPAQVNIDIYNIKGQRVVNLMDNFVDKVDEIISIPWNGIDQNGKTAGSGIYFYQLKTDNYNQIKKMTLIK